MTEPDPRSAGWITGRGRPPLWVRLIGCLLPLVIAVQLVAKRGVVVGVVGAVVFGLIFVFGLLGWDQMRAWSKRHPLLDRLGIVPLLFLAVAYFTKLPIAFCVLIALVAGVPLAALGFVRHRASQRNGR